MKNESGDGKRAYPDLADSKKKARGGKRVRQTGIDRRKWGKEQQNRANDQK